MLQPKRTKYRKQMKGRVHGLAKGGTVTVFGEGDGLAKAKVDLSEVATEVWERLAWKASLQ